MEILNWTGRWCSLPLPSSVHGADLRKGAARSVDAECLCLLSTEVTSQSTWLLFLPYFHLEAKTPVLVIIGVVVLLSDLISLLMIGQLFIFHLYLSTCPQAQVQVG